MAGIASGVLAGGCFPSVVLRLGLIALIVANVSQYLIQRSGALKPDTADALTGFLFGLAIGCLLLATFMKRKLSAQG